ncbi:MAG: hypothetical protein UT84_C0016G0014 [Candidatus Curtissbacteria bacterium GW2011_GWA1_40_16]|uniref:VanW family protein n=1 Tax=Candidatus Curtissbacteria bacterium GW2011_GWA1_40_16 TaxID=1618405 RepID=A0A0G0TSF0_9BACT|nr:MAG: hypothetical protein UT84_C0016G0014 [Candidatus Curtissbacteria bacterium GW2011_GWA1_40_16]
MLPIVMSVIVAFLPPNQAVLGASRTELASRSFSLENRYDNKFVNDVFKYNILLTVKYMGDSFTLQPGETFAFHDQVLSEYKEKVVKTTNAHFNYQDGFKSDGLLYGDGVCHLASLLYWAAKDAGLTTFYFANHNFAKINDVPREYGVSIKFMPGDPSGSARQNLYITNDFDVPVTFTFIYDGVNLTIKIY